MEQIPVVLENDLEKRYRALDERIVQLLLAAIPQGWWRVQLKVLRDDRSTGESGLSLSLTGNEGYKDMALFWIHEGRHYERLSPVVPQHATALDTFAERYWDFYAALQDYRAGPSDAWAMKLRQEFDELFGTRTGYDALDDRIAKTAAKKGELLTVVSHPSVPLHNNASELGARVSARRRDVSLHSRSVRGARSMDIFTTLVQTCKKVSLSAYTYFRDHLARTFATPSLASRIRDAAASC